SDHSSTFRAGTPESVGLSRLQTSQHEASFALDPPHGSAREWCRPHSARGARMTPDQRADLVTRDKRVVWHPYTPMEKYQREGQPLVIERAEGSRIFD